MGVNIEWATFECFWYVTFLFLWLMNSIMTWAKMAKINNVATFLLSVPIPSSKGINYWQNKQKKCNKPLLWKIHQPHPRKHKQELQMQQPGRTWLFISNIFYLKKQKNKRSLIHVSVLNSSLRRSDSETNSDFWKLSEPKIFSAPLQSCAGTS